MKNLKESNTKNGDVIALIHKAIRYNGSIGCDGHMQLEIMTQGSDRYKHTCKSLDEVMRVTASGSRVEGQQKLNFRQYINSTNQITVSVVEAV